MAQLSHDPLWPRAGAWPALADLEPGASVDLTLLGVPAWRTSLSPTAAHATPAAIREALRFIGADGKTKVEARSTWAIIDQTTGRLARVPGHLAELFMA